jgi:hypothetical protein
MSDPTTKPNITSRIGNAGKALRDTIAHVMQNIDENFITIFIGIAIIIVAIMIIIYYFIKKTYVSRTCKTMDNLYSDKNTKISNAVTSTDPDSQYSLRDYYIKTAYNCCSLGSYKNSFVSICMFKDLVRQGVRGFDFEVYSIDDQPVISTSTEDDNFYVKETYNYVPFSQVMEIITNASYAPNPRDPVIFHLRIKSTNIPMYENLAALFKRYDNFFLGPDYSFENGLKNVGEVKIAELQGKIVVIVDKSNMTFMDSKAFYEYVNMTSNSVFMRELRYYDVKNTPDMAELIQYNKKFMTIVLPDKGATPENPNPIICREMGCQMISMIYQNFDNYLAVDNAFYDKNGTAFELKPERLRYIPVYIDDPAPQNPDYSYATRNIPSDFYKFEI